MQHDSPLPKTTISQAQAKCSKCLSKIVPWHTQANESDFEKINLWLILMQTGTPKFPL